mmetsp:Transcript_1974/g.2446  ORF Transcript_1974/g.2446 Transcript_1974/m.2446 type:complete len:263 (-) Transcript_1974:92-880(-)
MEERQSQRFGQEYLADTSYRPVEHVEIRLVRPRNATSNSVGVLLRNSARSRAVQQLHGLQRRHIDQQGHARRRQLLAIRHPQRAQLRQRRERPHRRVGDLGVLEGEPLEVLRVLGDGGGGLVVDVGPVEVQVAQPRQPGQRREQPLRRDAGLVREVQRLERVHVADPLHPLVGDGGDVGRLVRPHQQVPHLPADLRAGQREQPHPLVRDAGAIELEVLQVGDAREQHLQVVGGAQVHAGEDERAEGGQLRDDLQRAALGLLV